MRNRVILTPFVLDQQSAGLEALARPDWDLNLAARSDAGVQEQMSAFHQRIAGFVAGVLAAGDRPISIAGDCCATLGVLAGLQRTGRAPVLLWLDAHGDFNTWETTPSGFLGGMPLAMIVGRGDQTMARAVELTTLPEDRVILSDARNLDPLERDALAQSAVRHIGDVRDLLEGPLHDGGLYVHFDTDVITPADAPAMSYPAPGGPAANDLRAVFASLAQTGQVEAVSMTTWTPALDTDGRSQSICMELLRILIER